MSRWLLPILLIAAALTWFAYNLSGPSQDVAPVSDAQTAMPEPINIARPDFSLKDLDGKPHHISEWDGKVVVLNFWGSWCPPCRDEIPLFNQLQAEYGKQGLQFIGVAVDSHEAVARFTQKVPLNYPNLVGQDDARQVTIQYGNVQDGYPYTVIIDRHGKVQYTYLGGMNYSDAKRLILPLLKPS